MVKYVSVLDILERIMAEENERNNGGKKVVEIELKAKTLDKVEKLAERKDESVEKYIQGAVHERLERAAVHHVLKRACESGEHLNPESKLCAKILDKKEEEHHHIF
jgi:hypothetical protein